MMQQASSDQPVISTTTGNGGGGNNGSQAVVHVRGDSEVELDLLFSVLRNGDQKSSYRNKNLPLSFFQPPEKKPTHSREGSHDLTAYASSGAPGVFHSRSHSSPAQLPLTMSLAPPMGVQMGQHTKQGSLEMAIPDSSMNALHISQQLPQQWNSKYPFNNTSGVAGNGWTTGGMPQKHQQQQQHQQQMSNMDLGPLPKGWEQGVTPDGDVYFIDHHNKRTSWTDPRTMKKSTPIKPRQGQPMHPGKPQIQHPGLLTQQHQLANQRMGAAVSGQLPPKSGQTMTRPKLKQGIQLLGQQQLQLGQQQCNMPFAGNADHLLKQLEGLRKEKERLQREQEEYDRKEQLLMSELRNHQLLNQPNTSNNQLTKSLQQQQQILHQLPTDFCLAATNGLLAGNPSPSANGGINLSSLMNAGGNGLNLMGGGSDQGGMNSPLDISDLTQLASLDVPSMLDSDQGPMESDDLISSLNDAMSSDLMLMDMQIDTFL